MTAETPLSLFPHIAKKNKYEGHFSFLLFSRDEGRGGRRETFQEKERKRTKKERGRRGGGKGITATLCKSRKGRTFSSRILGFFYIWRRKNFETPLSSISAVLRENKSIKKKAPPAGWFPHFLKSKKAQTRTLDLNLEGSLETLYPLLLVFFCFISEHLLKGNLPFCLLI